MKAYYSMTHLTTSCSSGTSTPVTHHKRGFIKSAAAAAILLACGIFSGGALAQPYPSKPITLIAPFGPGGASDTVARALGAELALDLKQPVLIENRPGASGSVAGGLVARAAPTGYTLMLHALPNLIPPALQKSLPFSGNTDFAAVAPIVTLQGVLMTSAKFPASDFKEFMAQLKANPGKYTYGTSGVGSPLHVWIEMLNQQIGTKSVHVAYKSVPDMVSQLVNGEIDYAFVSFPVLQFAASGKVKVMGVSGTVRDPDYPNIPTLAEQGLKGYEGTQLYSVVATKGTPPEVLQRLNAAIAVATARETFRSKIRGLGGVQVVSPVSPDKAAEMIAREDQKYEALVKEKRITFE